MADEKEKTDIEMFGEKLDETLNNSKTEESSADDNNASDEANNIEDIDSSNTVSDETEKSVETDDDAEQLSTEDVELLSGIGDDVLDVFREKGWPDSKIIQFAKSDPDVIEDVRELLQQEETNNLSSTNLKQDESSKKIETQKAIDELKFNLDPDIVGQDVADAINKLAGRLNEQTKGLTEEQAKLQSERDKAFDYRIDNCFDKFSKDLTAIGNASINNLSKAQATERRKIFKHALAEMEFNPRLTIERAIEAEIKKLKNQDNEKIAGQKLLDKLNKRQKQFTHPPTRRKSDAGIANRKFATEEEEKEAIMSEAYKEAGIDE